jgi:lysophospholipase L1-like esterase
MLCKSLRSATLLGGLLLVLLTVATLAARDNAPRSYKPAGPGEIYLALGDSLAWGFRLDDPATQSFPARLHARLSQYRTGELINLAVPGATSRTLLGGQLAEALAVIERARAAGQVVSPITLSIGGNDLQLVEHADYAARSAALRRTIDNLDRALGELRRAAGPAADIALLAYYNPYGGDPDVINSEAYWVSQFNTALRRVAMRYGATVADAYTPFAGGNAYAYTYILIGDVHANAAGQAVLAEQFWQALEYDDLFR